jgi:hypothetical protein
MANVINPVWGADVIDWVWADVINPVWGTDVINPVPTDVLLGMGLILIQS